MDLNTTWFLLIGVLLAGYAILDGFDLGVGVLHLFTRDEHQRTLNLSAIGPVWDGNEVWLLTAGGAMFAAFPVLYATVFSGFYLAFILLLFALIFRAVSMEFRSAVDSPAWRNTWDRVFGVSSLLPSILYGVAIGNVLRGLPVQADGSLRISLLELLNPYSILIGLLTLAMFIMQGSAYMAVKTEGDRQQELSRWITGSWMVFIVLYVLSTLATYFVSGFLFQGLPGNAFFWILLPLLLIAVVSVPLAVKSGKFKQAFLASSVTIATMIGLIGLSLYPRMVPSSVDLANSLTIYNSCSSERTLTVMLIIALVGMPVVIGYTAFIYRTFRGKVEVSTEGY